MRKKIGSYACTIVCVLALAAVCMIFIGYRPNAENPYRSYALQTQSWLEGRLDLGQDYPWLELAIYEDRYYVSFPPFPSYVLLPFCALFGVQTPDHWIVLALLCLSTFYAQRLYRLMKGKPEDEWIWVVFLIAGNGLLNISLQGWVWHMAQDMCFALSLMALYYAHRGKGGVALTCWMCAAGCRPMVVVYLPYLMWVLYKKEGRLDIRRWLKWLIVPALLAISYMALNYARFGNPLEFGHNYLPEFQRAENGQFSLEYLSKNWSDLFRIPTFDAESGKIKLYKHDCQAIEFINPICVMALLALAAGLIRKRMKPSPEAVLLVLGAAAHLMIVLCHRTLGGWQFGNRYIVDLLPYVFCGIVCVMPQSRAYAALCRVLCCVGVAVNVVGTILVYGHWI